MLCHVTFINSHSGWVFGADPPNQQSTLWPAALIRTCVEAGAELRPPRRTRNQQFRILTTLFLLTLLANHLRVYESWHRITWMHLSEGVIFTAAQATSYLWSQLGPFTLKTPHLYAIFSHTLWPASPLRSWSSPKHIQRASEQFILKVRRHLMSESSKALWRKADQVFDIDELQEHTMVIRHFTSL